MLGHRGFKERIRINAPVMACVAAEAAAAKDAFLFFSCIRARSAASQSCRCFLWNFRLGSKACG